MTIIREFSWCKLYGIEYVKINVSVFANHITIFDSYKIKKIKHMLEVLKWARSYAEFGDIETNSKLLQLCKWRACNLLHRFKYQVDRTRSVNLNVTETWRDKVGYIFLSLFYWK